MQIEKAGGIHPVNISVCMCNILVFVPSRNSAFRLHIPLNSYTRHSQLEFCTHDKNSYATMPLSFVTLMISVYQKYTIIDVRTDVNNCI